MKKVTLNILGEMKKKGEKIACLTAYDAAFSKMLDRLNVDILLVGDSLGMVLHGKDTTLNVTMADMVYHTRLVKSACKRAMVVADMPFMSYATTARAVGNAERLVSEGGAEMVKIEGGKIVAGTIRQLDNNGIPVCAHLGLTPQSIHKLGGYHVQGRDKLTADTIIQDASILAEAGAAMLVLECVPNQLAEEITDNLDIPVIGIGAGKECDGQVLVLYDILGISDQQPRFSKNFLSDAPSIQKAIENYVVAVKNGTFPAINNQF